MLPILFEQFTPHSVVDVGCGTGAWLRAASELGVKETLGIDGEWVQETQLMIPRDQFRSADLSAGDLGIARKFDMALSIEFLEHVPDNAGRSIVRQLCTYAPLIVISAAIPGQGSPTYHINERWQSYWAREFAGHGYVASDWLRRRIWAIEEIPWWYRQNVVIYARYEHFVNLGVAQTQPEELDVVHPRFSKGIRKS